MCKAVEKIPLGVRGRRWTLRDDNKGHYHGVVALSESPLYLCLSWRISAASPIHPVGIFLLDLSALLRDGYIRLEPSRVGKRATRIRIVREKDGRFYIQLNHDGPQMQLLVA